jgi:hypothetical protein
MSANVYHLIHVGGVILFAAFLFQAFSAAAAGKKGGGMLTGVLSLVVLVGGFGLLAKLDLGFPTWVIVKLVCWLGLAAIAGMASKRPALRGILSLAAIALLLVAVAMVYFRPF